MLHCSRRKRHGRFAVLSSLADGCPVAARERAVVLSKSGPFLDINDIGAVVTGRSTPTSQMDSLRPPTVCCFVLGGILKRLIKGETG
ncbi:hypothetical protein N658DRAFT_144088 [Parathielavia hyrcaniae]|uniref:Uncharacterized protein n=1 Tax=Parathielavia hyrcaniae TaxID=113614 RepID=A0AAN6Q2X5_9PEZI|nr:hypothetical protein N658DRAFT_144088 [Parathielavia hyrcaniae]